MRHLHFVLIGAAIPMLLTATVFAAPGGGIFGSQGNDAAKLQENNQISSTTGGLISSAEAVEGDTHTIVLSAETLSNGLLAYKMVSHEIEGNDVSDRYSDEASIPGPTIIINEGDEVFITLQNDIDIPDGTVFDRVSLHVHGVHYTIENDGTLEHVNGVEDEGASPGDEREFHWIAGPGTAGTWPYHDHTFGGINGAEHKGLFGTLIVNPASGNVTAADGKTIVQDVPIEEISKDFVLYIGDDAFWGMEIPRNGTQTPLWTNPTLGAKSGDYVRFHLIALGTDVVHTFKLGSYKWLDPGTDDLINSKDIGPLENHQFTLKVKKGNASYMDNNVSNKLMGMQGKLKVTDSGASSVSSGEPDVF